MPPPSLARYENIQYTMSLVKLDSMGQTPQEMALLWDFSICLQPVLFSIETQIKPSRTWIHLEKWVENIEGTQQRLTLKINLKSISPDICHVAHTCDPRAQAEEEGSGVQSHPLPVWDQLGTLETPFQKRNTWSNPKSFNSHLDITVPRSVYYWLSWFHHLNRHYMFWQT